MNRGRFSCRDYSDAADEMPRCGSPEMGWMGLRRGGGDKQEVGGMKMLEAVEAFDKA